MIEVTVMQVVGGGVRTAGMVRLNDEDASAEPEILAPLDGRTLAVVMSGLRKIAAEQVKAWEDFGDPTTPAGNGGTG
jgi:hypothetical protein